MNDAQGATRDQRAAMVTHPRTLGGLGTTALAMGGSKCLMAQPTVGSVDSDFLSRFQGRMRAEKRTETSIATYLRSINAALGWANKRKFIRIRPEIDMPTPVKGERIMRGRPLTELAI